MVSVVIADEEEGVRRKLAAWIALAPDIILVGEAAGGRAAATVVRRLHPDAIVMDAGIDARCGVEAVRSIASGRPPVRVVVFANGLPPKEKVRFVKAGAEVCISKSELMERVVKALRGEKS